MDNPNDRDFFGDIQADMTSGIDLQPERQIVTARGTGDGLVIRADGRVDPDQLKEAFEDFVKSRKRFLSGNDVSIEWVGAEPTETLAKELIAFAEGLDIEISHAAMKEVKKVTTLPSAHATTSSSFTGIAGGPLGIDSGSLGVGPVPIRSEIEVVKNVPRGILGGVDSASWDEADARIIASTVRGGQKIETEHSLIIFGDVNSGAELIAGGDIIVLGTLRGVAHAGAYDETGGGRVVFSLNMQATQLRIGGVISRGTGNEQSKVPEIARVDGTQIVVEPYQAKAMLQRRRD